MRDNTQNPEKKVGEINQALPIKNECTPLPETIHKTQAPLSQVPKLLSYKSSLWLHVYYRDIKLASETKASIVLRFPNHTQNGVHVSRDRVSTDSLSLASNRQSIPHSASNRTPVSGCVRVDLAHLSAGIFIR